MHRRGLVDTAAQVLAYNYFLRRELVTYLQGTDVQERVYIEGRR